MASIIAVTITNQRMIKEDEKGNKEHALQRKFPKMVFPDFPPKQIFHSKEDFESRRGQLEKFMQGIVAIPIIINSWETQFFLEIRKNTVDPDERKKVLVPLPDTDFDPTEVAVPWKILTAEGFELHFATENGTKPKGDQQLLYPQDFVATQLATLPEPKEFYLEMENDPLFCNPIKWVDIDPSSYDAMLLGGGHAPGMKQYLENVELQKKVAAFWKLNRPVAAICHGTLLLARTKDPETGKSVLFQRKTSSLPKKFEDTGYYMTAWKYGKLYRTYEIACEVEVRGFLEKPDAQFFTGPSGFGKGTLYDDKEAFVLEDGNYLSARWPGDAYLFGKKLLDKLYTS